MEIIKKNKTIIIVGILLITYVILLIVAGDYRYNKCVRIELNRCEDEKLEDYDCSTLEHAEELCSYVR